MTRIQFKVYDKPSVVIGANYGDEGKGLVTDYLAAIDDPTNTQVIRFNGGAQAGHTVVTPEGHRHVFHHFGSGTLAGASTFLSEYFALSPIFFRKEWQDLAAYNPRVAAHEAAPLTTPWDLMLNHARQGGEQDSCGMGFHETMKRHARWPGMLNLHVVLYAHRVKALKENLDSVRRLYYVPRFEELGLQPPAAFYDDAILERYAEDVEFMLERVLACSGAGWNPSTIYEGAQGLLLDQDYGTFPYVTHSHTGIRNALKLETSQLKIYYVTRCYLTRHGAGPLPHEGKLRSIAQDTTNIYNEHQGQLRYAPLDLNALVGRIEQDLQRSRHRNHKAHIVVTCLDQIPDGVEAVVDGKLMELTSWELLEALTALTDMPILTVGSPVRPKELTCAGKWPL